MRVRRRAATGIAALALVAATQAAAQVAPEEIADVAMRVCIRANPDASEGVRAPGFSVRDRLGRTAVYVHEDGPTMRLTSQLGFFACEIRVPDTEPAYLDNLLAELSPAIQERFDTADVGSDEDGMVWAITTEDDVVVTIEVARDERGVVSIVSSADAAPLAAPTR